MKKEKSELLQFLAGLVMLVAGLYIFAQKVMVTTSLFSGGLRLGGFQMSNGLIMIPFIAGIVWMFASGGKFASKVLTGAGILVIILTIVMTTNIRLSQITLYEWVIILVLIFGGAGLLAKILIVGNEKENSHVSSTERELYGSERKFRQIEDELEEMKRGK